MHHALFALALRTFAASSLRFLELSFECIVSQNPLYVTHDLKSWSNDLYKLLFKYVSHLLKYVLGSKVYYKLWFICFVMTAIAVIKWIFSKFTIHIAISAKRVVTLLGAGNIVTITTITTTSTIVLWFDLYYFNIFMS